MPEFLDTFVKFSNFTSRGGAFDSLFCLEGRVFVHNDCPGGEGFCSLQVVYRGFVPEGMVMDEVDTCINTPHYTPFLLFPSVGVPAKQSCRKGKNFVGVLA